MKFNTILPLTLLVSSAEALIPDGVRFGGGPAGPGYFNRQDEGMGPRYGDMALQNDYFGMPSYSQGMGGQYGRPGGDEFGGMPSFGPGPRGGMGSFNGRGPMMGGFSGSRGGFGGPRGGMSMAAVRGVQADQDAGVHSGMGDFARRGRDVMSEGYGRSLHSRRGGREEFFGGEGGRPSFHHAMGGMNDFRERRGEEGFGMGSFYGGGMDRGMGRREMERGMGGQGRMDRDMGRMGGQGRMDRDMGRMGGRGGMDRGFGRDEFGFDRRSSGFNQTPLQPNSY